MNPFLHKVSEMILEKRKKIKRKYDRRIWTGFKLVMKTLDGGRISVAAQGLGIAEGARCQRISKDKRTV